MTYRYWLGWFENGSAMYIVQNLSDREDKTVMTLRQLETFQLNHKFI